jgi:hypothetical protein
MKIFKKIKKNELIFVFAVAFFLILLTSSPYIYGLLKAPTGYQYLGIHMAPSDIFVYESYVNQIKEGNIFLTNHFHNDLVEEKNFNIFWLVVGLFAKIFNLPALIAIHLFRIILIPLCLLSIYLFLSLFFKNIYKRKIALLLISFSSGLGAILSPIIRPFAYIDEKSGYFGWPMDLWVSESNTFLTFYHSPHFIASLMFLVLIFYFFLQALNKNKYTCSITAGLLGLIYFNFHPFYIVTIASVLLGYLIFSFIIYLKLRYDFYYGSLSSAISSFGLNFGSSATKNLALKRTNAGEKPSLQTHIVIQGNKQKDLSLRILKHGIVFGALSLPSIIYHIINTIGNPIIQEKAAQNVCKTTSIPLTIISFGIPLLLAIYSIYYLIKIDNKLIKKYSFVIVWLIVNFIIIYLPFLNFQRRLIEGIQIPIIILATISIFIIYEKYKHKKLLKIIIKDKDILRLYILIILITLSLSNLYIMMEGFLAINQKIPYTEKSKIKGFAWIDKNTDKESAILSNSYLGNIIPAFTNRNVFIGHWVETTNYQEKQNNSRWFFEENNEDQQKKEFLKNSRINYIFYSDIEEKMGEFNPNEKDYLKSVYNQDGVKIFKVLP